LCTYKKGVAEAPISVKIQKNFYLYSSILKKTHEDGKPVLSELWV
jgi:hypothetical protein